MVLRKLTMDSGQSHSPQDGAHLIASGSSDINDTNPHIMIWSTNEVRTYTVGQMNDGVTVSSIDRGPMSRFRGTKARFHTSPFLQRTSFRAWWVS